MNVSIFQARIPATLYSLLKELAYKRRASINSLIVEAVRELLKREGE